VATLQQTLRKKLEEAVIAAREIADAGAKSALEQLAVHSAEAYANLPAGAKDLRLRLRAHARQLGDVRDSKSGEHDIGHLTAECAYEHWHRMLFARFLAENGALMHPDGVPVTLAECGELAETEGAANGWELAGRYAARMLPQVFRPDAPTLAVSLPPEYQRKLEQTLAGLPADVFKASDALGWVYQFWQAKRKEEVNASQVPIGADELPAVTQLFTEPYMVEFLLHNTLGAWWASKVLAQNPVIAELPTEDEVRAECAVGGCGWRFLRFRRSGDGTGPWVSAAGDLAEWPRAAKGLRVLDPCCGSGHFLVAAFDLLVRIRMAEEGLDASTAGDAVLRENIHGLELDRRCAELAAFAVALAAWTVSGAKWRPLPQVQVAWCGARVVDSREAWGKLAGGDTRLQETLQHLHGLFSQAEVLGSLVDPLREPDAPLWSARFEEVAPYLLKALTKQLKTTDAAERELQVSALDLASAAQLLCRHYHLLATNVPFLAKYKQCAALQNFTAKHYPKAATNLATVFIARALDLVDQTAGAVAVVTPSEWLTYTKEYEALRKQLLRTTTWRLLAPLGKRAFQTISGEVVDVSLLVVSPVQPSPSTLFSALAGATPNDGYDGKATSLLDREVVALPQVVQTDNPGATVVLAAREEGKILAQFAICCEGLSRGDGEQFDRFFWELGTVDTAKWSLLLESPDSTTEFSGRTTTFRWDNGEGSLSRHPSARVQGREAWGKRGVVVSRTHMGATLSCGGIHAQNCVAFVPRRDQDLPALWVFLRSEEYRKAVLKLNQKLIKPTGAMDKVPFNIEEWRSVAKAAYPHGLPTPNSHDPTQYVFDGAIASATEPLQAAVARLVGYAWPSGRIEPVLDGLIDDDGIVCIPSVRGEPVAEERLLSVLQAAFGGQWSSRQRDALLEQVGARGKSIDWWLRNKFFEQHCKLFGQRPFVWNIWDGLKRDGFSVLVNYHKLDHKLLETLAFTYLGDWIKRQHDDAARNVDGAAERLDAARILQARLKTILDGEAPYDVFVRWKTVGEQSSGWHPDLDDGVRMNIRPFMSPPDLGGRGAGILRYAPNVSWSADRGQNPENTPWFREFEGARVNDHHLTLAEKRTALRDERGSKCR